LHDQVTDRSARDLGLSRAPCPRLDAFDQPLNLLCRDWATGASLADALPELVSIERFAPTVPLDDRRDIQHSSLECRKPSFADSTFPPTANTALSLARFDDA
jgi:hypothetical protein